jgi:pilus assembly protein CpaB
MNRSRIIIMALAACAAIVVAFVVRGFLGGGTQPVRAAVAPPPVMTQNVLVASNSIQPGTALTPELVHWQAWPKNLVDSSFITADSGSNIADVTKGVVVRVPLVEGQPLSTTMVVHGDASGMMAALLEPGTRAVSFAISTDTGAGGFILPNDRVDVILTQQISDSPRRFGSRAILKNIRVLALDQTSVQDKEQKTVLAKTATLELSPHQADLISRSAAQGTISLALRALGDNSNADPKVAAKLDHNNDNDSDGQVTIVRYGIARGGLDKGE